MGQRSQTFIKVYNPLYAIKRGAGYHNDAFKKEVISKWQKPLGMQKFTILAYHHQWLYGITFPCLVHKIMEFYSGELDTYSHPKNIHNFFTSNAYGVEDFIKIHTDILSIHQNPWVGTREKGVERFTFLNEDIPFMRQYFNRGDNNDGIVILDPIEGKYAFMFLSEHFEYDTKDEEHITGKPYELLTAAQYVEAYYPITFERDRQDIDSNTQRIQEAETHFAPYNLLTKQEIIKMFPKCEFKND